MLPQLFCEVYMKIEVSDISDDIWIEEVKQYLEARFNFSMSIVNNKLVGYISDAVVDEYTKEEMRLTAQRWCEEIFDTQYDWSD